jgi:hypothetical protein
VAQIAARLINPLNEAKPIYDAVAVGDYRIKQNGHHLSVSRDDQVILVVRDGAVVSNQLQTLTGRHFWSWRPGFLPSGGS